MSGVYSGSYNSALTLSAAISNVTISGTVNAAAMAAETSHFGFTLSTAVYGPTGAEFTVANAGLLTSAEASPYDFGILLAAPGSVNNSGTILDSSGIGIFGTTGYVTNSGLIFSSFNSTIINPEPGIYLKGAGTAINTGTIIASSSGVYMGKQGGTLAGFVSNAATGIITGNIAVYLYTPGTLLNAGTIFGGSNGVFIYGEGGFIQNTGSIIGTGNGTPAFADGIFLEGSDVIVNGASNATNAIISGTGIGFGVDIAKPVGSALASIGTVVNYGTIRGGSNPGIGLAAGTVINGTVLDTLALVTGIKIAGGNALVNNFGTINGNGQIGPALEDYGSGIVLNGATNDTAALIESNAVNNISLGQNETLTNYGTIDGGSINGIYAQSGVFSNAATGVVIGGKWGAHVAGYGAETVTNAGLIQGTIGLAAVAQYSYNDVFSNSGTIASILGSVGTAIAFAKGNDLLVDDPGSVFIGTVSGGAGKNTLELAAGTGSVTGIGAQFIQFGSIDFDAGGTWYAEGDAAGLASGQTISGFASGDTIILDGFTEASFSYVTGAGLEIFDGTSTDTLDITGIFSTGSFSVTPVVEGTEILLCYLRGTRIMTPSGEVLIENLRIGDPVVARFGGTQKIKWIGRQSFGGVFVRKNRAQIPVRIAAGALGRELPQRDLYVSPGHSMLLGDILVLAQSLLNGVSITQDWGSEDIHYYQLEFETHDCVLAEGVWSESFADGPGMRGIFHNVTEFYEIFPAYRAPDQFTMCAPRPEFGPALEAALRPVLALAAPGKAAGPIQGWIDHADGDALEGWAVDAAEPAYPVALEVVLGDWVLGATLACGYREDLAKAGLRHGWCRFLFPLPANFPASAGRQLQVRRRGGGAGLPMSAECLHGLGIGAESWRLAG